MLPGINGLELCQTFRAEGGQTPVLMLTAMAPMTRQFSPGGIPMPPRPSSATSL